MTTRTLSTRVTRRAGLGLALALAPLALITAFASACGDSGSASSGTGGDDSTESETEGATTGAATTSSTGVTSDETGTGTGATTDATTGATTEELTTSSSTSSTSDALTSDALTSGDATTGVDCPEGTPGCPCGPEEQCDEGFACNDGVCGFPPYCGDGNVDPGEACDDGNQDADDGCEPNCKLSKDLLLWELLLGEDTGASAAHSVALDPEGDLFVAGTIIQDNARMAWLGRVSPDGELLWEYTLEEFTSSEGWAVTRDPEGALLLVGHGTDAGPKGNNSWLGKLSADGELLWSDVYDSGPDSNDGYFGVATDYVGDIYVVGNQQPDGPGTFLDIIVRKLDGQGEKLWTDIQGPGTGADVVVDSNGNALVTGALSITNNNTITGSRAWMRKYKPGGELDWEHTYSPANDCVSKYNSGRALALDEADFTHLTGAECLKVGGSAVLRQRFDTTATMLWTSPHDAEEATNELGNGAVIDPDGDLLIAGSRAVAGEGTNAVALCTDADGQTKWSYSYHVAHDEAFDIAAYEDGTVVIVGSSGPAQASTQIWIARYNPPAPMMMP